MKKSIVSLFIVLLLAGCSSSGNMPLSKEYTRIENRAIDTDRMMSSFSSSDQNIDDGSIITSFYHNGILKKIHIEKDIVGGLESRDCYFHQWRISYITDTRTFLDMGPGNNTTREAYYFQDDNFIGWRRLHGRSVTSATAFNNKETELLADVEKYLLMNQ